MRLLLVATGRNPGAPLIRCLKSIKSQTIPFEICAVNDASEDGTKEILEEYAELPNWTVIHNTERKYGMANQITAWNALEPSSGDVIVFVDLDDALAHERVLERVRSQYEIGAWMTYGSYRPVPSNHPNAYTCTPAKPYPERIVERNSYRNFSWYCNHLRTVSWDLLSKLTEEDLRNDEGNYWEACIDAPVMIPCLEMSGVNCHFIPEVLYEYTCNLEGAVWRSMPEKLNKEWQQLRNRRPKDLLTRL